MRLSKRIEAACIKARATTKGYTIHSEKLGAICHELKVNPSHILKIIDFTYSDIKVKRKRKRLIPYREVYDMRKNGSKLYEIAAHFDCSISAVGKAVKQYETEQL